MGIALLKISLVTLRNYVKRKIINIASIIIISNQVGWRETSFETT